MSDYSIVRAKGSVCMVGKRVVAIDIGTSNIKVIVAKRSFSKLRIIDAKILHTPKDCIINGEILNKEKLILFLTNQVKNLKIIGSKTYLSIASPDIIVRDINLRVMKEQDLEGCITYEAEQYVVEDISSYIIDYKVSDTHDTGYNKIMFTACPKTLVEDYIEVINSSGLKTSKIEIGGFALYKLINFSSIEDLVTGGSIAVIDVGESSTKVSILNKDGPQMYSLVAIGCEKLMSSKNTSEALINLLQQIHRIFEFYTDKDSINSVDNIYIIGGGCYEEEIKDLLSQSFGKTLKKFPSSHIKGIDIQGSINPQEEGYLLQALALLVPDKSSCTDLYSRYISSNKNSKSGIVVTFVVFIVLIFSFAFAQFHYKNLLNDLYSKNSILEEKILDYNSLELQSEEIGTQIQLHQLIIESFKEINQDGFRISKLIKDLDNVIPSHIIVTKLKYSRSSVEISAITSDYLYISNFIINLENLLGVKDPIISNITADKEDSYRFTLIFKVN